ncbi:MAG: hypothetical protein WCD11_28295 [Solirubrobacteraceae bacterium]
MGTGDQRVAHLPGRDAEHLGGDRGQLDPGVLQDAVELDVACDLAPSPKMV